MVWSLLTNSNVVFLCVLWSFTPFCLALFVFPSFDFNLINCYVNSTSCNTDNCCERVTGGADICVCVCVCLGLLIPVCFVCGCYMKSEY